MPPDAPPSLRWQTGRPDPRARVRLLCLPFAGAGASVYRSWFAAFSPGVNVGAVQLPGREDRLADAPCTRLPHLVASLAAVLQPVCDVPYVLFGHSMGAMIAFELAHYLQELGRPLPERLFLSAHPAPHRPRTAPHIHALPDREFLDEVRRFGGTPDALLDDPEFMALAMPLLRADFTLCETYRYVPRPALDVPLTILGGTADRHVPVSDLEGWEQHSRRDTRVRLIEGDHFFVQHARAAVIQAISEDLEHDLARG